MIKHVTSSSVMPWLGGEGMLTWVGASADITGQPSRRLSWTLPNLVEALSLPSPQDFVLTQEWYTLGSSGNPSPLWEGHLCSRDKVRWHGQAVQVGHKATAIRPLPFQLMYAQCTHHAYLQVYPRCCDDEAEAHKEKGQGDDVSK